MKSHNWQILRGTKLGKSLSVSMGRVGLFAFQPVANSSPQAQIVVPQRPSYAFASRSLLLIVFSFLAAFNVGHAQDLSNPLDNFEPIKTERPSFAYEQCFNACTIAYDRSMNRCFKIAQPENDDAFAACYQAARESYRIALSRCPPDVGRQKRY